MVQKLEHANEEKEGTITCIEIDFPTFYSEQKYNFVFSPGFIEHFEDTFDVIKRHVDILSPQGTLLIILPNFLGLNGWIQKTFDRKKFDAHNLDFMVIKNLRQIMDQLNLSGATIEYTSKPMLWLEPKPTIGNKIARMCIKMMSHVLKLIPIKCRFLYPYIVISQQKS